MAVGGDDDLLVLLVERVEGVEERFLGLYLVLQELDIVHQEHVVLPVALLELQRRVVPHGVDEVVSELLAGYVADAHAGVLILHVVAHGAQEVRLPEPDPPIDEQWVVDEPRGLRHRQRCRVGEPVAGPDDEGVERVLGLEGSGRPGVQHRLRPLGGSAVPGTLAILPDAHDQRSVPAEHGVEGLLQQRAEAALDVLLGERVGNRDLEAILVEVDRPYPLEPNPQGRDVYVLGGAIQDLRPDLFYVALHRLLPDPGADDGFYVVLPERADDPLARFVRGHQTVLLEHREVAVGGADADLQPLRHRRRPDLAALQHRDQDFLLPLGDVHPRYTVWVAPRRRERGLLFLVDLPPSGYRDGRYGAAADVVLEPHRPPYLLRRRPGDTEPRAHASDLTQCLGRRAGEAEFHRPVFVLHPRPLVRDPNDVAALENGNNHPLITRVHKVLDHLAHGLLGRLPPHRPYLVHHEPGELRRGRPRVCRRHLSHLGLPRTRVYRDPDANARAPRLSSCSLRAYHPQAGI